MEYLSLLQGLSSTDIKDLAKQMKICCQGNPTTICNRIVGMIKIYEGFSGNNFGSDEVVQAAKDANGAGNSTNNTSRVNEIGSFSNPNQMGGMNYNKRQTYRRRK